ncbi:hypothetical protein BDF20DRAFT_914244 [Mycotypha africana]|uniref:uncharacterized protein n=1 Tax=Mycotypha africana TaxID=64632 RepID=UPI002300CDFF|nr:uncharacterized protein BDF20DRAFT_914244 [Mycotypha africana]KAI8975294.1 hypothetical protein BDF20DRAFT_914244 [Mycotypha africana]
MAAASTTQYYLSQFDTNTDPLFNKPSCSDTTSAFMNNSTPIMSISPQQIKSEDNNRPFCQSPLYQLNSNHVSTTLQNNRSETCSTHPLDYDQGLHIRVDGIPSHGAKSRVETQIKLTISLTTKDGAKVPYWSYVRIPEKMLARSKLRKSQQQKLLDGSAAAMVSDESKVLALEARVVCESDENKKIKMCQGCVRRERKRAERKKDAKLNAAHLGLSAAGVADEAFERDRKRILLFNTEPLVNFSTGDAVLPTRITCYCRHHNERIGFRVRFVMKNDKGNVVATGESPPIMITDDHKSSKQPTARTCMTPTASRKRRRTAHVSSTEAEDESSSGLTASTTPPSPITSTAAAAAAASQVAFDALTTPPSVSSASQSSRILYGSDSEELAQLPPHQASPSFTTTTTLPSASTSPASYHNLATPSVLGHFSLTPLNEEDALLNTPHASLSPRTPTTAASWQSMMLASQTSPYHHSTTDSSSNSSIYSVTPTTSTTPTSSADVAAAAADAAAAAAAMAMTSGLMSTSLNPFISQPPVVLQGHGFFDDGDLLLQPPRQKFRRLNEHTMPADTCSPSLLTVQPDVYQPQPPQPSFALPPSYYSLPTTPYDRTVSSQPAPAPAPSLSPFSPFTLPSQLNTTTPPLPSTSTIPTLDRIVPSHGPSSGGIEITLLGENFHPGLTLMFGNRPATTLCVNATSMVVLLPPADVQQQQGSVMVSFKDHPLMRASPLPPVFHYYFDDTASRTTATFPAAAAAAVDTHPAQQQTTMTPYSSQLNTPTTHIHPPPTSCFPAPTTTASATQEDPTDMSFIYLS